MKYVEFCDAIPWEKVNMDELRWQNPQRRLSKEKFIDQKENVSYVLLNWFWEDGGTGANQYRMFQNPMNVWKIVFAVSGYCLVTCMLYSILYFTQHIPGSQAALAVFQD